MCCLSSWWQRKHGTRSLAVAWRTLKVWGSYGGFLERYPWVPPHHPFINRIFHSKPSVPHHFTKPHIRRWYRGYLISQCTARWLHPFCKDKKTSCLPNVCSLAFPSPAHPNSTLSHPPLCVAVVTKYVQSLRFRSSGNQEMWLSEFEQGRFREMSWVNHHFWV